MAKVTLTGEIPKQALSWRNDPNIYKWCRQETILNPWEHDTWLERIKTDKSIKMFGILADRGYVGVCGLTSIDRHNQKAEFSLYIEPKTQGLGYGSSALSELLSIGFNDMNMNRIWGETFPSNPALKMFKSLGMREEGVIRHAYWKGGGFIDSVIVSILRTEWLSSQ